MEVIREFRSNRDEVIETYAAASQPMTVGIDGVAIMEFDGWWWGETTRWVRLNVPAGEHTFTVETEETPSMWADIRLHRVVGCRSAEWFRVTLPDDMLRVPS